MLAVGLIFTCDPASAAPKLTFTDTWKDAGAYNSSSKTYSVKTTGSLSASISLPLSGVDLSEADAGTQFLLSIGPAGNTVAIISDALGNAENYRPGRKNATFAIIDPISQARIGNVTVSWTDSTISVNGLASEDILGVEQALAANSVGIPTNTALNSSITGNYYEVSLTLDASDNGGGTFTFDNQFVPVTGTNKETEYKAPNGSGSFPLENGSITGTVNFTSPKLTITSPPSGFEVYDQNPIINLRGVASDDGGITNVVCIVNEDGPYPIALAIDQELSNTNPIGLLPSPLNWTAEVDLSQYGQVGTNTITVVAQSLSGSFSIVSRTFLWVETNSAVLTITPPGSGTVKGITNGQVLQKGTGYPMTAAPANKTWMFSEWNDGSFDLLSTVEDYNYIDTDGMLTALFVSNPFYNTFLAGTYTGLFFDPNTGPILDNSGYITLTVTETGALSGKLSFADSASPVPFSAQLSESPDGSLATATTTVKRNITAHGQKTKAGYFEVNVQIMSVTNVAYYNGILMTGYVNEFSDPTETNLIDSAQIKGVQTSFCKFIPSHSVEWSRA
jgi:hypothetical protein